MLSAGSFIIDWSPDRTGQRKQEIRMCLFAKSNKNTISLQIATKDIVVFKVLKVSQKQQRSGIITMGRAPVQGTLYKKGGYAKRSPFGIRFESLKSVAQGRFIVNEGLYSYESLGKAKHGWSSWINGVIVKMIIPKGSVYLKGMHGKIVSNYLIWR